MYQPECKYKLKNDTTLDYLLNCKENNQAVVGLVKEYDFEKQSLIVDLGNGITGILPEKDIDPTILKFPVPDSYSLQAHNLLGKIILTYVQDMDENKITLNRKRLHKDIIANIDKDIIHNVHIKGISKHGLYVDISGGAMGFIPMEELSTTFFLNLNDIGIYVDSIIPAVFIQNEKKSQVYPTMSYRKVFKNYILPEGSCVIGIVRKRILDKNEFWVEINPNSKGIVEITNCTNKFVGYGSTILCKIVNAMPKEQENGTFTVSYKLDFIAKLSK